MVDRCRQQAGSPFLGRGDPQFPRLWVGEEPNFLDPQAKFVENGGGPFEQRSAKHCRLDAAWCPVEQPHTQNALQVRDGPRYDGTRDREALGRLGHAVLFDHGHEDMKVPWFKMSTDPICQVHGGDVPKKLPLCPEMQLVDNSNLPITPALAQIQRRPPGGFRRLHGYSNARQNMTIRNISIAAAAFFIGTSAVAAEASAIKVLSSPTLKTMLDEVRTLFERQTGHNLALQFDGVPVLKRQIEGGEIFDIAILLPAAIDDLVKQGKIGAG